jgi:hypothetical protein
MPRAKTDNRGNGAPPRKQPRYGQDVEEVRGYGKELYSLKKIKSGGAPIPLSLARSRYPIIGRRSLAGRPFIIQGYRASDLEWRTYLLLKRLGFREEQIQFQVDFLGGRMPGGQVLDFVVWTSGVPVVIAVDGDYWHGRNQNIIQLNKEKDAIIRGLFPQAKILHLFAGDLEDEEVGYRILLREVGRG